jgi:hypothetical protein
MDHAVIDVQWVAAWPDGAGSWKPRNLRKLSGKMRKPDGITSNTGPFGAVMELDI